MITLVTTLYILSGTILFLYLLGWCVFRLRRGFLFRSLNCSLKEIHGEQPNFGMKTGLCAICKVPVTYNDEKKRWVHDDGQDVYVHCTKCGYTVHGSVDHAENCPKCGEEFPCYANIVCQGFPVLPKWRTTIRKIGYWFEDKWDWLDSYYNHQLWGFTIPGMFLAIGDYCWRRYNVVKCRDLSPRFHEPSDIMPHAMFELLRIHVEEERPDILETPDEVEHREGACEDENELHDYHHQKNLEIKRLYLWWTQDRDKIQREIDFLMEQTYMGEKRVPWETRSVIYQKIDELEEKQAQELEDMMVRLVKVHQSLWS